MRQPAVQDLGPRPGPLRPDPPALRRADVEQILDAVAESRAAVEINGDPHRLDMEPRWIREAREARHPLRHLHRRPLGEGPARTCAGAWTWRAGAGSRKGDVLNTRGRRRRSAGGAAVKPRPLTSAAHLPPLARLDGRRAGARCSSATRRGSRSPCSCGRRRARRWATCSRFLCGLYFRGKLDLRARVRAPARRACPASWSSRPAKGCVSPDLAGRPSTACARCAAVPIDLAESALPRGRSARDAEGLVAARRARVRGRAAGQRRHRQVRGRRCRGLRRAPAVPRRLRGARGHEPRRAAAALRGRAAASWTYVPVAGAVRHGARPPRLQPRRRSRPARDEPRAARPMKAEPRVTRNRHPATTRRAAGRAGASAPRPRPPSPSPATSTTSRCALGARSVHLTNLRKPSGPSSASPRATSSSTTPTSRPRCCPTCATAPW